MLVNGGVLMACGVLVLEPNALFACIDLQACRSIVDRKIVAMIDWKVAGFNGVAQRHSCCKGVCNR